MNFMKTAASDQEYEKAFFQIAYDKLQEKLHNLIPYLVGFEIVQKEEKGDRAVGVFGFKSNNGQIIYVPAFYINGTVKGVDILYSKNHGQFFPLTEDYAEEFLKDDPTGIGDPSDLNINEVKQQVSPVNFGELVRPPRTGKVAYASVIDYVKEGDKKTKEAFVKLIEDHPKFAEAILTFYPIEKVAEAAVFPVTEEDAKEPVVDLVSRKDNTDKLTAEQKRTVATKGHVVVDKRTKDQISEFGEFNYEQQFRHPDENGFYSYLTADGGLNEALILNKFQRLTSLAPITVRSLVLPLNAGSNSTVYSKDNKAIFVRQKYIVKEYKELYKDFLDPSEAKTRGSKVYVLINKDLVASELFYVNANYTDAGGVRRLQVSRHSIDNAESINGTALKNWNRTFKNPPDHTLHTHITLVFTKKEGRTFTTSGDVTYVPAGFRLLEVSVPRVDRKEDEPYEKYEERRQRVETFRKKLEPGDLGVLRSTLNELDIFPFKVQRNGSDYYVSLKRTRRTFSNPLSVKIAMLKDYGLDEAQADHILNQLNTRTKVAGHIKLAYTGDYNPVLTDEVPFTNELGQLATTGQGQVHTHPNTQGEPNFTDPLHQGTESFEGIDAAIDSANHLAQLGQKEIFDTQAIATLAKHTSATDKIKAYLPDMVSTIDKLGRMLFLIYLQPDKFEQQFGRSELPELLEMVDSVFKQLGELVMFLKRKSPNLSIEIDKNSLTI